VFILASREAALALPTGFVPVDHAVAGIIDIADLMDEDELPPPNVVWKALEKT